MIRLKNVYKSFDKKQVLKGVDLDINDGEVVVIIGPSGSGKTTLLRCINFLEKADSGTLDFDNIHINFKNVDKKDIEMVRKKSSMVFQNYALFLNKTAMENIAESLIYTRGIEEKVANERAANLLNSVGLADYKDYYPDQLSGGQQQRVGIARALAVNPDLILFDEPTSSLDPQLVSEVLEIIKNVAQQNITTLIVTHEIGFAYQVADKVIFMADGLVIEQGKPDDVLINPQNIKTKEFLKSTQKILENMFIIN